MSELTTVKDADIIAFIKEHGDVKTSAIVEHFGAHGNYLRHLMLERLRFLAKTTDEIWAGDPRNHVLKFYHKTASKKLKMASKTNISIVINNKNVYHVVDVLNSIFEVNDWDHYDRLQVGRALIEICKEGEILKEKHAGINIFYRRDFVGDLEQAIIKKLTESLTKRTKKIPAPKKETEKSLDKKHKIVHGLSESKESKALRLFHKTFFNKATAM